MAQQAQPYDPYEDEDDPLLGRPTQTTAQANPYPDDLRAQAQALYGGRWDADAEGDFANRMRGGQSVDQLLANTADDYSRRFTPSTPAGSGQTPQYQTPTQQWNSQPAATTPAATATQTRSDELYQLLMQRAQQGTAIGRDDPNVRSQVDPAVAQMERASRNSLDDIAERSGPLANMTGERRLAGERTGQAAGQLEAEVTGRLIEGRRNEIMQSLALAGDQISNEERLALELQLGQMADASRTADRNQNASQFSLNLGQNNDQFMRELALREWDLGNTWDYRWQGLGG